jgi:hypothetical protein
MGCKGPSDYEQLTYRDIQIMMGVLLAYMITPTKEHKFNDEVNGLFRKLEIIYQELMPECDKHFDNPDERDREADEESDNRLWSQPCEGQED